MGPPCDRQRVTRSPTMPMIGPEYQLRLTVAAVGQPTCSWMMRSHRFQFSILPLDQPKGNRRSGHPKPSGLDITPNFEYCPSTSSMQTYSNYDIPDTNHDMHSTVTQGTFLHDLYEIQDQNSHTKSARYISTQCPPASAGLN